MKKIALLVTLLMTHPLAAFYFGAGMSLNTIDETFSSTLETNTGSSGQDHYESSQNRLAPAVQLGYQLSCNEWLFGGFAKWKYLNYQTPNVNSSRGQILPNATFSSINIFGPEVIRDFTSKTRLHNEVQFMAYLGRHALNGYAYLGLGPVLLTAASSIYVTSVHTPNGVGSHLISTSVTERKTLWGGAASLGYQYFFNPIAFLNISYTYMQSAKCHFNNAVNAAQLNGADTPGPTTLFLRRSIEFSAQEVALLLNLVF